MCSYVQTRPKTRGPGVPKREKKKRGPPRRRFCERELAPARTRARRRPAKERASGTHLSTVSRAGSHVRQGPAACEHCCSSPPRRLGCPRTGGKRFGPVACATCVDARPSGSFRRVCACLCVCVFVPWDGGGVGIRVLKSSSSPADSLELSFSGAVHADLVRKAGIGQTDGPTDRPTQSSCASFVKGKKKVRAEARAEKVIYKKELLT